MPLRLVSAPEHARRCGELLSQAKREVGHGAWLPWLAAHCPAISEGTAQDYMRIARHWPELTANPQHAADLSLRQILASLRNTREADRAAALAALPPDDGIQSDVCRIIASDHG